MAVLGGTFDRFGNRISATRNVNVVHVSTGHYTISFVDDNNSPLAMSALVVTQLPGFDGDTRDNAVISTESSDNSQFTVKTGNSDGNQDDRGFSFIGISVV